MVNGTEVQVQAGSGVVDTEPDVELHQGYAITPGITLNINKCDLPAQNQLHVTIFSYGV